MINPINPIKYTKNIKETIIKIKPHFFSKPDTFEKSSSRLEKEVDKITKWENLSKIKVFKNLRTYEINKLIHKNKPRHTYELLATLSNYKPAYLTSSSKNLNFTKKITSNKNNPLDIVCTKVDGSYHSIILNKNLVLDVIKNNKDIYTHRLNIDKNSSINDIYKKLQEQFKKNLDDDILGITLGFPRKDSMIFALENKIKTYTDPNFIIDLRNDVAKYKQFLLKELDNSSIYKDTNLKNELKESINSITQIKPYGNISYRFINYNKNWTSNIDKQVKGFEENFLVETLL